MPNTSEAGNEERQRWLCAFCPARRWYNQPRRRLTLFARSVVLIAAEIFANALIWVITAIVLSRNSEGKGKFFSLALLAWTIGLRHGLDADHISAIDNATRRIVSLVQRLPPLDGEGGEPPVFLRRRPVTVGLFFSLGHSTIVFSVTVAIAISTAVADRLDGVGAVGGDVGAAISGSFLVLIAIVNSFILANTLRRARAARRRELNAAANATADAEEAPQQKDETLRFHGCLTRTLMPLLRAVDRPWKMYPIGVAFGFGFDTASSIALLGVAGAVATRGSSGGSSDGQVVLLAFLFTAGMSLVDSLDSVLMVHAYAYQPRRDGTSRWALFENIGIVLSEKAECEAAGGDTSPPQARSSPATPSSRPASIFARLSILLTFLSILVALVVGTIELLGLIGSRCGRCAKAAAKDAERPGSGGLEGRWWNAWAKANDASGYVGAGIVGSFFVIVLCWVVVHWGMERRRRSRAAEDQNSGVDGKARTE